MTQVFLDHDEVNEIDKKYGHTLIGMLRDIYGAGFANDAGNEQALSDTLPELDDRSLKLLVTDFKSGRLADKLPKGTS